MTDQKNPPAGWYPNPSSNDGLLHFWDGRAWSGETRLGPGAASGPAPAPARERKMPLLGRDKLIRELWAERDHLESELLKLRGMDVIAVNALIAEAEARLATLQTKIIQAESELRDLEFQVERARDELVKIGETAELQEVGIYEVQYPGHDTAKYRDMQRRIREEIKSTIKDDLAVSYRSGWTVEGSEAKGKQMVKQLSKLMLRAYNGEADEAISTLKPYRLDAALGRLDKSRASIARLGTVMGVSITETFHNLRKRELRITADYLNEVQEERERQKEERERAREEELANKEFIREQVRLEKELATRVDALDRARASMETATDPATLASLAETIAVLEAQVAETEADERAIEERFANRRAGHVYIISNLGAMGESMVKIGMTRRLDPTDRIMELGDASVPFRFDTHAIIYSRDAVQLETNLHQHFRAKRVNLINFRREFFRVTPHEVMEYIDGVEDANLTSFNPDQIADEYRRSEVERTRMFKS